MEPLLLYLLKVNLALAFLYVIYKFLFRNDTFFQLRRFTLLSILLIAFLYPLPDISNWLITNTDITEVISYYTIVITGSGDVTMEETILETQALDWKSILTLVFGSIATLGAIVLFIRCMIEIYVVARLWNKRPKTTVNGTTVCLLLEDEEAYSFFNWIFISRDLLKKQSIEEIIIHEQTHVDQHHSADVVLAEFICILFWYNPFTWLLKQEISANHEFIADQQVMNHGYDKKVYQYHLIGMEHPNMAAAKLYNNFSVLPLKKRISMLNKKRTNGVSRVKYLTLIPLAAGLLILNNIDAVARVMNNQLSNVMENITEGNTIMTTPDENTVETLSSTEAKATPTTPPASQPITIANDKPAANSAKEEVQKEIEPAPVTVSVTEDASPTADYMDETVFAVVEKMPSYPGGDQELLKYISRSIVYPIEAQDKGIQGRVVVTFIVGKDGRISNAEVVRGVDPLLDAEAIRIVNLMPIWMPGTQRGQPVNVKYTLPVVFRLQ